MIIMSHEGLIIGRASEKLECSKSGFMSKILGSDASPNQDMLDELYSKALDDLRSKAEEKNANAVVAVTVKTNVLGMLVEVLISGSAVNVE